MGPVPRGIKIYQEEPRDLGQGFSVWDKASGIWGLAFGFWSIASGFGASERQKQLPQVHISALAASPWTKMVKSN